MISCLPRTTPATTFIVVEMVDAFDKTRYASIAKDCGSFVAKEDGE